MEVSAAAPAVARNGGFSLLAMLSSSSQPSRNEWRVISEQTVRNSGNEELGRSNGQSDERLIYEQRLHALVKQREELQHMEFELRAQVIARSEIAAMQSTFGTQIKEHANANVKLQEQLHEKEKKIHELEKIMKEKEKELHAIRLDNEAAWAKVDIIREQSKELQSYRKERDNSESERVQHIKQIHDVQEHIQDKDRQFVELQEQHRIAQETILFKDELLQEAQAWITHVQEMNALQSTTNLGLQADLQGRTELYYQLWLGFQRQLGEMKRLHLHIQQLQLELADVREKSGSNLEGSHGSHANLNDASEFGQNNSSQLNGNGSPSANSGILQNGKSESASGGNTLPQADHVHGVALAPSSLVGMPTYIPNGQVTALHPFFVHQQGIPHSSHVMKSQFCSVSSTPSIQNWQNQLVQPDGQHVSTYSLETKQNLLRTDNEVSGRGEVLQPSYADTNMSQGSHTDFVTPSADGERQILDFNDKSYGNSQSSQRLQQIGSQFHDALRLDPLEHGNDGKA